MATNKRAPVEGGTVNAAADQGRRRFLGKIWTFLGLAAVGELCFLGASFMLSRKKRDEGAASKRVVEAGTVDSFKPGTTTAIPAGRFFLSRLPDGGFLALSPACTHLGCMVLWDEKQNRFACPCHGSSFGLTGEPLTGPAARPLDYYPTRIENGVVKTDVALARRRERFEPDQATRI